MSDMLQEALIKCLDASRSLV